ncbi:MAG: mechanosensitive ion channel [Lachnospiraceae bacterium]|nr:mechanosensitive ion channel [Lachnospiraceae bacterium]
MSALFNQLLDRYLGHLNEGIIKGWLTEMLPEVVGFFWAVVLAIAVYVIGVRVIRVVISIVTKPMELRRVEKGVIQFTRSCLRILLYAALILIILQLFGVQTSSVAAAIASVGLTAGLALQGSLSNFAGGVLILLLHPFVVGDYIIEDTHGNEGHVSEITIFYTKLRTPDNKIIVIPNGVLANNSLTNATMSDRRRIDLVVSIGYQDDIRKAKGILLDIAAVEDRCLSDEPVQVFVNDLGDSAVELGMRFWVATDDYWAVRWKTLEEIKNQFDAEGITIPYNQMDVHLVAADGK